MKENSAPSQDLRDVSSPSQATIQDLEKSFSLGGGSRFLKKTSKDATEEIKYSVKSDYKLIPQHSSQSVALNKLALIENRIQRERRKVDDPNTQRVTEETQLPAQSSSDPNINRFLKKNTVSAAQEHDVREFKQCIGGENSFDSDEKDMQRLLGESFSLSEGSLKNELRQRSLPVKKLDEMNCETHIRPSLNPVVLNLQSPSSGPLRPESRMVQFTERSSESGHSEIHSLDELFPVSMGAESDTLSETSKASDDFKLNVMTLDDLAPLPFKTAETSQEMETPRREDDRNRKSKQTSPPSLEEVFAAYESDFESEIVSEIAQSASESSERLVDDENDASYSSYRSQGKDRSSSRSSTPSRRFSDSSSSDTTITGAPIPERNVKEAAVQTQEDAFTNAWSSGNATIGPSLGMKYTDPTPIASHTVSTEALETLTSYSPSILALNDMLRQQLSLTRAFIDSTRRHYNSVINSLDQADYKYTTLQETKEFIRAHRMLKMRLEDALEEDFSPATVQ
ncbi:hypothetical protein DNTS_027473 [Danionella cerebrum]|uniref:DUF4614 domain-containing protein n=1 Tax=Danionella cerebrum TaxID=2873325 RepID=A0A553RMA3_9TELE|nr:hypothetical protein DNTS_027473 [Danionella translucida]